MTAPPPRGAVMLTALTLPPPVFREGEGPGAETPLATRHLPLYTAPMHIHGHAHKYGDHVDTDVIIPARYLASSDADTLAAHCMEDLDADFVRKVQPDDLIVAGRNFGCGSSREHAPLALKAAGVSAVIAESFARIFYRNALNIGLPIIESEEAARGIESGDEVEVDLEAGVIHNLTRNQDYTFPPLVGPAAELVAAGGLRPLVAQRLAERG